MQVLPGAGITFVVLRPTGVRLKKVACSWYCPWSSIELRHLLQRAVSTIEDGQREFDQRDLNKCESGLAKLERGFVELDRAFVFGSKLSRESLALHSFSYTAEAARLHKEAAPRLRWARFVYGRLKAGEAMAHEDWYGAINWLGAAARSLEDRAFPNEMMGYREIEARDTRAFARAWRSVVQNGRSAIAHAS